jgi:hypothetical protein
MDQRAARIPPVVLLVGAGLAVGLLAVGFRAIASQSVSLVLFSFKGAAYALSLGTGFRGGPTFPAVALGVAVGVLASILLPGLDLTPALIAGLAAAASAALGLSSFGALLAGSAAAETIPIAVIASVIGWLMATALQQRETRRQPGRAPAG